MPTPLHQMTGANQEKLPYESPRPPARRRLRSVYISLVLFLYFIAMPLFAGIFAVGDRRGPKLYQPQVLHEILYRIGWSITGRTGKPRISAFAPPRPWFYGLHP